MERIQAASWLAWILNRLDRGLTNVNMLTMLQLLQLGVKQQMVSTYC